MGRGAICILAEFARFLHTLARETILYHPGGRSIRMATSRARERILDAATRLFSEEGINATSVDRVIDEADVAPMTVYRHFGGKEELVTATLERWSERFVDVHRAALRELLRDIAGAAGAPSPDDAALQLHLLIDGATAAAAVDRQPGAAGGARAMAAALLAGRR